MVGAGFNELWTLRVGEDYSYLALNESEVADTDNFL
jgi:hypothetical protein